MEAMPIDRAPLSNLITPCPVKSPVAEWISSQEEGAQFLFLITKNFCPAFFEAGWWTTCTFRHGTCQTWLAFR